MSKRYALIIAVEAYQDSGITGVKYAENDANELASVIKQHGFLDANTKMMLSSSATKTRIESAIRTFFRPLEAEDHLLVFYAGHGFSESGQNFITCYDTILTDLTATSVHLQALIKELRRAKCQRILLLLDCCHSGLQIDDSMRGLLSEMTDNEFEDFCEESKYHIAFASCNTDEYSFSSDKLKHGIWTHHVIEAFDGLNKVALDRDRYLTTSSLQNYLSREVPRTLRRTFTGAQTQTPRFWGNLSREVILADFAEIFAKREAECETSLAGFKKASFLGLTWGSVRSLSGFRKFHRVPDQINDTTRSFVQSVGTDDLSKKTTDLYEKLKDDFHYRRREIDMNEDDGRISILTPDFTVNIDLDIDEEDPTQYVISMEVAEIRNVSAIETDSFASVFDDCFDRIVIAFTPSVPVKDIIDSIEQLDDPDSISVQYPVDAMKCTVQIEGFPAKLYFDFRSLTVKLERKATVYNLLMLSKKLPLILGDHKISALLPAPEE